DPPVAPDLPNLPDQRFVPAVAGRPAAAERPSAGVPEPPAPAAPSIEDGSALDAGAARGGGARLQQAPAGNVAALIAPRGLEEERIWLRKAFGRQYAAMANSVARVLSEHPGFHDAMAASSGAVLTDAVSVRLYLSPEGDEIDQLLRLGKGGPHVPFARCVVSGLSRLPSHRGPTLYRITPTAAQWEKYRQRSLITDWGFMHALTTPCAEQDGDADVFLWSITGRRTRLLEPERESVAGRVLFVPGSNFKILDVREPAGGERAHILLRELAVAEVGPDGQVRDRGLGLDEMATESLRRAREAWAGAKPPHRLPESARPRFQALPGLV
ncbi:MAG TPA: hypothetical protein VJT31_11850, partial [Rugosimonospora sp.]|nr:hypothetical protein [Rugosimonospora sp.]